MDARVVFTDRLKCGLPGGLPGGLGGYTTQEFLLEGVHRTGTVSCARYSHVLGFETTRTRGLYIRRLAIHLEVAWEEFQKNWRVRSNSREIVGARQR